MSEDGNFAYIGCGGRRDGVVRIGSLLGAGTSVANAKGIEAATGLDLRDRRLALDRIEGEPTPPSCDASAPPKDLVVDFYEKRATYDGKRVSQLRVRIKDLGIDDELVADISGMYCRNTVVAKRYVDMVCSTGGGGTHLAVRIRSGVVFIEAGAGSVATGGAKQSWGGLELGCGLQIRSKPFSVGAGRWTPYGDACNAGCTRRAGECSERCSLRESDDDGELTSKGQACAQQCQDRDQQCRTGCERQRK
ncbi:MAG: hypothetical protein HY898_29955 [Deltaproteobacteria bacterium]|nr:hypothetical protein [Deltaproteobacteria bacterium]